MRLHRMTFAAALATLAMVGGSPTRGAAAEDSDIVQKVESAKTPADHEAIASYYDQQAAAAKKKAAEHERMAATYKAGGTSIGKGSGAVAMPQHCQALVKDFNDQAAQYTAMAEAHRQLAKSGK